jgi:ABC-type sugar transport system permease subunit
MKLKRVPVTSYLFLVPAGLIYLSIIILPVFYSLFISLFKWNGIGRKTFIGLSNFINLFHDGVFVRAMTNNLIWVGLSLFVTMTVALGFAVVLNKQFRGRTFFRGFFYFPTVIAPVTVAIIWRWIYNPGFGFINLFLKAVGSTYQQNWIAGGAVTLFAIYFAALWRQVGQPMIFFLAGLQTVPVDVLEAAIIDGASNIRRFFSIVLPMMKETFIIVMATLIVNALKVFDIINGLTAGGPNHATEMMSIYMYSQTFRYNNVGYGTAISVLMVVFMLIVIVPYIKFTAGRD